MNKLFYFDAIPSNKDKYIIRPNFESFPLTYTTGSFNVLPARFMNLSYAQYLRMCRDLMGAEIQGKGSLYPVAYFTLNKTTRQFLALLNSRAEYALHKKQLPNLEEDYNKLIKGEKEGENNG